MYYEPGVTPDPIVIEKPVAPVTPAPFEPPTETPKPAPVVAEKVRVSLPASTKVKDGRILVKVKNGGTRLFSGTVSIKAKGTTIATAKVKVAGGRTVTFAVKLTSAGKKLLKGKKSIGTSASYSLKNTAGSTLKVTKKLAIKL